VLYVAASEERLQIWQNTADTPCSPLVAASLLNNWTREHFIESYIWGSNHCVPYKIHLSGGYQGGLVELANKLREY
jgi:hypothetical protein